MSCTEADFAYLRAIVLEQSANVLDASRDHHFEARLRRLLKESGFETLDRLVAALRRKPDSTIKRCIAEAMTVNETSFFRDRTSFDLMRLELLPTLIQRRASTRRLRFWSAACSTGQEAYSLAITLCEHFPQLRDWDIQILGTDICAEVVERAREGCYQRIEVNRGLPVRYLLKYMYRAGDEWQIIPSLKHLCRFRRHNLCNTLLLAEKYDVILLRNVMLYFPMDTRRQLLLNTHRLLEPGGFLILGASEQPALPSHFEPVLAHDTCYYKPIAQH